MEPNRISDFLTPAVNIPAATPAPLPAALVPRTAPVPDLYAMAWALAVRDHELDRLFNADFYQI